MIEGFEGTLEELAQRVGRMRYDKITEFLDYFEKELRRQENGDRERGRTKLAGMLDDAVGDIGNVRMKMERIYAFCKPFMKDELDDLK